MKSSLNLSKKSLIEISKRATAFLFVFVMLFAFILTPVIEVKAQAITTDPSAFVQRLSINAGDKFLVKVGKTLVNAATVSFQKFLKTALDKIAYDTATYLGSGGRGQKPLFITQDWGAYLVDIADQSAGQFIENFVSSISTDIALDSKTQSDYGDCMNLCNDNKTKCVQNIDYDQPSSVYTPQAKKCVTDETSCLVNCKTSANTSATAANSTSTAVTTTRRITNVCQPSSVQAKLKISLGLVEQSQPNMPNCSATELVKNWGDYYSRVFDFERPDFLNMVENVFNPVSNDLGIFMALSSDLTTQAEEEKLSTRDKLIANKGWKDVTNIARDALNAPGTVENSARSAEQLYWDNLGKTTGNIALDAANIFLNQISLTAFNTLMSRLGERTFRNPNLNDYESDPSVRYGEGNFKDIAVKISPPQFSADADYNVLIGLSSCPDSKNPGPTECVISDTALIDAIAKNKTVGEALKSGALRKDWILSKDNINNAYTLRNISILRKYRILPLSWEQAVSEIYSNFANRKNTTLGDLVACFSDDDEYEDGYYSKNFNKSESWCRDLIDPSWVLKAPLGYCAKEGIGAQITYFTTSSGSNKSGVIIPSVYSLTRASDYCADEQTCIKENSNGTCDAYGYCNEEKRTWKFTSNTCEPINNTCQTFTNSSTKKQVSYLQNTLTYGDCNAGNSGCTQYLSSGSFDKTKKIVVWNTDKSIYLSKVDNCSKNSEGCTELIRIKPTWGANLIMNSDFSDDKLNDRVINQSKLNNWPLGYSVNSNANSRIASIVNINETASSISGDIKILKLTAAGGSSASNPLFAQVYSSPANSILPLNFELVPGESYTFSADVYLEKGEKAAVYMGLNATNLDSVISTTSAVGRWERLSVTRFASDFYNAPLFGVQVTETRTAASGEVTVYVKNLKFEVSNVPRDYNLYGAYKVYQKLIPPYLEDVCYQNNGYNYNLKTDAPDICNNFTRRCNADEVGCELFTNKKKSLSVSAQVASEDYCRDVCVGYDMYISRPDYFNSSQVENIIPANTAKCSAAAVGCNEFTNLDTVNQGGEGKEYYSELKQCIKPNPDLCASFYNWERTANGSQLRLYTLQKDTTKSIDTPKVTADDRKECNENIYKQLPGEALYNPDCKEFYNVNGQISYHLLSKTITCSGNCVSYRLSNKNVDESISTSADCAALGQAANWDASAKNCNVCLNGGIWDRQSGACIYQAIPSEGKRCSAAQVGCREYNGSDGDNVRMISSYNFETSLQGWNSNCSNGLTQSPIASNKNGSSAFYKSSATGCALIGEQSGSVSGASRLINQVFASDNVAAQLKVGKLVSQGKSYSLRFIAKSDLGDVKLKIYFYNNNSTTPEKAYFSNDDLVVRGGGAWNIYQVNLGELDHSINVNEILAISADKDFYFDDVVLTEITDRYYLIKGTSQISNFCYADINGKYQGESYNLGCAQYLDRSGGAHSLRKFSKLCSNSSVGCEQMIKTQNYDSYKAGIWNDTNSNNICDASELDCVKVGADEAIYAIYNSTKSCNSADKGCSLMGQMLSGTSELVDVYKKNNPNLYETNLCGLSALGCSTWTTKDGASSYFKDPGNDVCQYRSSSDPTMLEKGWYLIPVNRCDMNKTKAIEAGETKLCKTSNDCGEGDCIVDNNNYPCTTSYLKTFGFGGSGNVVPTPQDKVGLCEAKASGCTEYIDPVSHISPNLVGNPEYKSVDGVPAPWTGDSQTITIDPNKLYTFSVKGSGGATILLFAQPVRELLSTNNLGDSTPTLSIVDETKKITFLSLSNNKVTIRGGAAGKAIDLKEVIINYQLKSEINQNTCQTVSLDNGCILFNERSINGAKGVVSLSGGWDAFSSLANKPPVSCTGGNCNTNKLIKVSPNRVCSKWLHCLSYIIDEKTGQKVCYAVGQCNRLEGSECVSYEDIDDASVINRNNINKNATGYYLWDKYHLANMKEVGLNTDAHYDFEEAIPVLSCRKTAGGACIFDRGNNISQQFLVREPDKSPIKDYPANGKTYLKVPAGHIISPQAKDAYITIIPNKDYYANFLVNTSRGGKASVNIITAAGGETKKDFESPSGWSREVFKFNPGSESKIRIELSMPGATESGEVYFDDINIEPVLQVGPNNYVAKECRLYPTNESLTCVDKNNTVIKDGLEGYCLEHDANNKNVCLMWYPIDKISSTQISRNTDGYQGKFPLNYCTEVDGNFDLVKKLEGKPVLIDNFGKDTSLRTKREGGCYLYDENIGNWKEVGASFWTKVFELFKTDYAPNILKVCPSEYKPIVAVGEESDRKSSFMKVMCIPKESELIEGLKLEKTIEDMNACNGQVYYDGWAKYDGILNKKAFTIISSDPNDDKSNGVKVCQESKEAGEMNSWCTGSYKGIDEGAITNPVRVLDYNRRPTNEEDLKLISGNDPDKTYRLACNNFIQMVSSNGENKAWADRVSNMSIFATTTPAFFVDYSVGDKITTFRDSPHFLQGYGRNREDTPFGAAIWPDSFDLLTNQGAINLRNQLSTKNKEDVLAGRPYGCSNYNEENLGSGCNNIGYCSLNPNVFCLNSTRTKADIQISVDQTFVMYINGKKEGESPSGKDTINLSVYKGIKLLEKSKNVLAIKATDISASWGIAASIDGIMTTDKTEGWKCTDKAPVGDAWLYPDFNDTTWPEAVFSKNPCSADSKCPSDFANYKEIWASGNNVAGPKTVYCRYSFMNNFDSHVSRKTCSEGGYGTCLPLWGEYLGAKNSNGQGADYVSILSKLFLQSYGSYKLSGETYGLGDLNISTTSSLAIKPSISNVKWNNVPILSSAVTKTVNISDKGLYRLEFTTKVNKEQQPLKEIYIKWGDGREQVVKGRDDSASPHVFYHYYSSTGTKQLEIEITDNWGQKGSW